MRMARQCVIQRRLQKCVNRLCEEKTDHKGCCKGEKRNYKAPSEFDQMIEQRRLRRVDGCFVFRRGGDHGAACLCAHSGDMGSATSSSGEDCSGGESGGEGKEDGSGG